MKTKILLLIVVLASCFSAQAQTEEIYYVLSGRSNGLNTMHNLLTKVNPSGYPLHFSSDETIGNKFNLVLYKDYGNTIVNSGRAHITHTMLDNINRHLQDGRTGEQLLQLCGTQLDQMLAVFRTGLHLRQELLGDLITRAEIAAAKANACNCPDDKQEVRNEPDLGNTGSIVIFAEDYANRSTTGGMDTGNNYGFDLNTSDEVTRTWVGRNLAWLIPVATVVLAGITYTIYKLSNRKKTTYIYNDPNNPGEDHNPNGINFGRQYQTGSPPDGPINNIALPNGGFPTGGFNILSLFQR